MKIEIKDSLTIADTRKNFEKKFPFLKLEFFSGGRENAVPNPLQRILDESKKLSDLRTSRQEGEFQFSGEDKVSTLENAFRQNFALNVQVFRKSGKQWLLTTTTDNLTLNQQNEMGREMSIDVALPEPEDIHEQE